MWRPSMDLEEEPQQFVLLRHFYGVNSSTGLLKEAMNHAAAASAASQEKLLQVAELIRNIFVDDLNGSFDSKKEVEELRDDLK